ncbi:rac serine/threonine-protein kinase [Plakobranchus ocellatus]|uniref:Rac serine/threonine-protein kinase n=1 Tax=Plakobranchus ocellatus TaxID=259542 RepID=A0AAV4DVA3_9GAST|nr:rac serine/threonine-protein kinase [Plakobranchus ocellatus]
MSLPIHLSNSFFQIPPPWKPEVESEWDTKYIPEEFAQESLHFTPGSSHHMGGRLDPISEDGQLPHFEQFSYQGGSRGSYNHSSYLSTSATGLAQSELMF